MLKNFRLVIGKFTVSVISSGSAARKMVCLLELHSQAESIQQGYKKVFWGAANYCKAQGKIQLI